MPRRDADAVYKAFRAACDALFQKRDDARDAEANAHRAEIDGLKAEIDGVIAGGDDVVARAIAVRAKASEQGALGSEIAAMVSHVLANHAEAVRGTELDPTQLRAKREQLIARAVELVAQGSAGARRGRGSRGAAQAGDAAQRVRRSAVLRPRSGRGDRRAARELEPRVARSWTTRTCVQQARFDDTVAARARRRGRQGARAA